MSARMRWPLIEVKIDNLDIGDLDLTIIDQATFSLDGESTSSERGLAEANAAWLAVTPNSATIAGGDSKNFTAKINSTGLTPGVYKANIIVRHNDPSTPNVKVPVTLTVKNYTANLCKPTETQKGTFDPW